MPYTQKYQNYKSFGPQDMSPFQEAPQQPQAAPEPDMLSSEDRIRRLQRDVHAAMHSPPDPMLEGVPQSTMSDASEMLVPPPNHIKVPDLLTGEEVWRPTKKRQPLARANPKKSAPPKRKPRYTLD